MRYPLLDTLRGFSILSMVLYHFCWDLVNLKGRILPWYSSTPGYLWQQSICWAFIFISGFSLALSLRHKNRTAALKKAVLLLLLGSLITAVTLLVMPQDPIWFGVLFLLGAAALVLPLLGVRTSLPPAAACFFSFLFFFCTRNLPTGFLGFEHLLGPRLPSSLYTHGLPGAFLGFRGDAFHSADYFPLFPWVFLFAAGYFACRALLKEDALPHAFLGGSRVLSFPGRHSLLIYLLHQPLLVLMMPGISLF